MNSETKRFLRALFIAAVGLVGLAAVIFLIWIPSQAQRLFGPPAKTISLRQKVRLSYILVINSTGLLNPVDPKGKTQDFTIYPGEKAAQVARRLQQKGLVPSAEAFSAYLAYKGLDRRIRQGKFRLSSSLAPTEIAVTLQYPLERPAVVVVLPGWRREQIAQALSTTGLKVSPREFLAVTAHTKGFNLPFAVPNDVSLEGFLFPGRYELPRDADVRFVVRAMLRRSARVLDGKWQAAVRRQGLTPYQGLILASIVQRETHDPAEMPLIASVYYNRLRRGMALEADPTVQYAMGKAANWWQAPLDSNSLRYASPYNTYLHKGLPPTPIANPGLDALKAVASPANTDFLFFRAACEGAPHHLFSRTYKEHLQKACH